MISNAGGSQAPGALPAYTMPAAAPSGQYGSPAPAGNNSTSYGVGASGGARQPFGGPAAPVSTPVTYGSGSAASGSGQSTAVPQQRGQGTVYGGLADYAPADMTMPVNVNPVENSGSLTGHILAQGWRDGTDNQRRSNVKVAVAMLIVLLVLVGVSVLFLFTVGDAFSDMIGGVFKQ
ncbi:hypothetical protein AB0C29_04600 [Actinoplanes sp. NPDC048791]|uniref:hypothetical protein n=1 Tax=Actinoplanes sp. NPDC048791 TaxID=3154623 RepID=UPI0033D57594